MKQLMTPVSKLCAMLQLKRLRPHHGETYANFARFLVRRLSVFQPEMILSQKQDYALDRVAECLPADIHMTILRHQRDHKPEDRWANFLELADREKIL